MPQLFTRCFGEKKRREMLIFSWYPLTVAPAAGICCVGCFRRPLVLSPVMCSPFPVWTLSRMPNMYRLEKLILADKDCSPLITGEWKESKLYLCIFSAMRLFLVDLILLLVKYLKHIFILLIVSPVCEPGGVCPARWLPGLGVGNPLEAQAVVPGSSFVTVICFT